MKKMIFVFIIVFIAIYFIYDLSQPIKSSVEHDYIIRLKSDNIYVRTVVWGVSGGHEAIVFSSNPIMTDDVLGIYDPVGQKYKYKNENNILVYYQPEVFYKKIEDTLFIYSMAKANGRLYENTNLITIIPVRCKVNEWYSYKKNYRKYGLMKLEVY